MYVISFDLIKTVQTFEKFDLYINLIFYVSWGAYKQASSRTDDARYLISMHLYRSLF